MKLTALTQEQQDRIPEYREEGLAVGLATGPCDRQAAELALVDVYRVAGLEPPELVVWFDSPMAGVMAAQILSLMGKEGDALQTIISNAREGEPPTPFEAPDEHTTALPIVIDGLIAQLADKLNLDSKVAAGMVNAAIKKTKATDFFENTRKQTYQCGYGQHDSAWLSFYRFFYEVCDVEEAGRLMPLWELAKNCGWWWPFEHAAILTDRATVLNRDDQGRLHSTSEPAIGFADGQGIFAVHGVRVPRRIIESPETITVTDIRDEQNAEVRRVMMTLYGEGRFLEDMGAEVVDEYPGGTLLRAAIPDDEDLVMIRVLNSTPEPDGSRKTYFLRVPPDMTSAKEAVAWTFNLDGDEYKPQQET